MILHSPESAYAKEMVKWEAQHTACGPGLRPYVYREYPKMLYKAGRLGARPEITERIIVGDEDEQRNYESRGFCDGQELALEALHAGDREIAGLAANRAYQERGMGELARAEAAAADASTSAHLPMIPETPIKRRPGRPAKKAEA